MSVITFKLNMNNLMQKRQITQAQLAKLIGLSTAAICKITSFKYSGTVSAETLEKLSNFFHISMDDLYKNKLEATEGEENVVKLIRSEDLIEMLNNYLENKEELPPLTVGTVETMIRKCEQLYDKNKC